MTSGEPTDVGSGSSTSGGTPSLSDEDVADRLGAALDVFVEGCLVGDERPEILAEMLALVNGSSDPAGWGEELGEAVASLLDEWEPAEDEEPAPAFLRCLRGARALAAEGPIPSLAWTYGFLHNLDELSPAEIARHFEVLLGIPGDVDPELKAHAFLMRGHAHELADKVDAAIADWRAAYALSADVDTRSNAAWSLAASLAESDPVDAADWGWRAATEAEATGGVMDAEAAIDLMALQSTVLQRLGEEGTDAATAVRFISRLLTRPDIWPDELTACHLHVVAATGYLQLNKRDEALAHLELARPDLPSVDDYLRSEWQLARGEVAVLYYDVAALDEAIHGASPYVLRAGDAEARRRLAALAAMEASLIGDYRGMQGSPFDRLDAVVRRVRAQVITRAEVDELLAIAAACDPESEAHLEVVALAVAAMTMLATTLDVKATRDILDRAYAANAELMANPPGGFPAPGALLRLVEVQLLMREEGHEAAARVADRTWREQMSDGARNVAAIWAAVANALWSECPGSQDLEWESIIAAVTSLHDVGDALGHVHDRLAWQARMAMIVSAAVDSAERQRNPRLMAELLEVLRSQGMPIVTAASETLGDDPMASVWAALMAPHLSDPTPERDALVELPAPPFVVMPWGSIALGPWLAYDKAIPRTQAQLTLVPIEEDNSWRT
jgi:hypothetical protein